MKAELITIGDEILIGQIVDTNSVYMAKALNAIGVSVHQITSIQDDKEHILAALASAKEQVDIVLITGGLGPTKDDITKHTLCEFFDDTLTLNEEVLAHVAHLFKTHIKKPMLESNRSQAMVPSKAEVLTNRFGTAPGMWFEHEGTIFVSMPGVPYEMKGLMENEVIPKLRKRDNLPFITHTTLLTYGMGESRIAERIEAFENNLPLDIKLAYLPSLGRVRLRLSSVGMEKEKVLMAMENESTKLKALIPDIFVGFEEEGSLEEIIGRLLVEREQNLSIAESCTGGAIVQRFTENPGTSAYLQGSVVTYATESKVSVLGVSQTTIDDYSVVSSQVAKEMAEKVRALYDTDYAISTTGNAGPTKGDADVPVGTVFIGVATRTAVKAYEFSMGNHRARVIGKTVNKAMELLQEEILKN